MDDPGVRFRLVFSETSILTVRSIRSLTARVNRPEHEAGHLYASNVECRSGWMYDIFPPYAFKSSTGAKLHSREPFKALPIEICLV
jgi:hypothetical protein